MRNLYRFFTITMLVLLVSFTGVSAQNMTLVMTSPVNGTNYDVGAGITITLESTGTITAVQLFYNGFYMADLTPDALVYEWIYIPNGVYELSAVAYDSSGNTVTSEPVTINVGQTATNNRIVNGEFNLTTWPWRFDNYEGAVANIEVFPNAGLTEDSSAAYITFQAVGNYFWGVQLMQQFKLQQGHTYEVSFVAWATEQKPIQITFSMDYSPWAAHWWEDIVLEATPQTYGPYTYECDLDDPQVMFKFVIGGNLIPMFLDAVQVIDTDNMSAVEPLESGVIREFELKQNYPNPFNPTTRIGFNLEQASNVDLGVYNLLGERVATAAYGSFGAGYHEVQWDASNFAAGVYFYQINTENGMTETRKMVLLK
jgi:hypothetical protein